MTIGIYKLNFNNTNKVYIGQSQNIEARIVSHYSSFKNKTASPKLQEAFELYGKPTWEILVECRILELDKLEEEAIEIYNSYKNGFNSTPGPALPPTTGVNNANSRYREEQYYAVLKLLVSENPVYTKRKISELTGVSLYVVRHIASLESHAWLKDVYPQEYSKLEEIKLTKPYFCGKTYPLLKDPLGNTHNIQHVTNFCKMFNLSQPKISEVLMGKRKSYKGWKLENRTGD